MAQLCPLKLSQHKPSLPGKSTYTFQESPVRNNWVDWGLSWASSDLPSHQASCHLLPDKPIWTIPAEGGLTFSLESLPTVVMRPNTGWAAFQVIKIHVNKVRIFTSWNAAHPGRPRDDPGQTLKGKHYILESKASSEVIFPLLPSALIVWDLSVGTLFFYSILWQSVV